MYEKEKTVCFTGHRKLLEPRQNVEKKLEDVVRECIAKGARTFIAGGAIGFDYVKKKLCEEMCRQVHQITAKSKITLHNHI